MPRRPEAPPHAQEQEYWPILRDVVRIRDGSSIARGRWIVVSVGYWPNPLLVLQRVTSARQRAFKLARLGTVQFEGERFTRRTSEKERA